MRIKDREEFFKFIHNLDEKDKHTLLTEAVRPLFNTVGKEDILRIQNKKWFFGEQELDENGIHQLIEEVKFLKTSKLWKVLQKDLKYQANKRMFVDSRTVEDMVAGKLLLLYIDIIETRLKEIK